MILKSNAKFEGKLICCFKNDRNLVNFDLSTQKSQKTWTLNSFCTKHIMFDLKKYRGVIFYGTCGLGNYIKTMVTLHQSTWKSQNRVFDGILLSKVENAWATNLQRIYVYWHWRMIKNLKRNWCVVSKLTWQYWQTLTWVH